MAFHLPLKLTRLFPVDELAVLVAAFALTSFSAWWVHHLGLTLALTDATAHLNFSRLVSNSLTPGISQIGFWPPLLQILMAPFAALAPLYKSGLAGYVTLVPFMMAGSLFLYRIVKMTTGSVLPAATATSVFLLNPYVLYYGSVPMMEMLYVSLLFGSAYFLLQWLERKQLKHLIWLGSFVTLTALARYEGLLLIPLVGAIVLLDLRAQRSENLKVQATLLMFGMLVMVSVLFILAYSWVFGGSPLAFTSSSFIRDPAANLTITQFNIFSTLRYFASAQNILIGSVFGFAALVGGGFVTAFRGKRFQHLSLLAVLLSPALFILGSMFAGHESVLTPGLPPYSFFHNDRYALTWIGFVAVAPILAASLYARKVRLFLPAMCAVLVGLSMYHLVDTLFIQRYPAVTRNINGPLDAQRSDQLAAAEALSSRYDYGYVLITRSNEDPLIHQATVPLKQYIYEANYRYFGQAVKEPQVFARFIVAHNPNDTSDTWSKQHDILDASVLGAPDFNKYYTLVYQNTSRCVYEVNQPAVIQLALSRGYNPEKLPSLVPQGPWNPETLYAQLTNQTAAADLLTSNVALTSALQGQYKLSLQPGFAKGYQVDASRNGSSENQAYALRLALQSGDAQTFDTVWKWTQSHLERPDHLIASQFMLSPDGGVQIKDNNSASSADLEIAQSLIQAGRTFNTAPYAEQGSRLIGSIWEHDTEYDGQGRRHVLAGNWGRLTAGFVMNAQAMNVDALQSFILIDPSHDWAGLKAQTLSDLQTIGLTEYSGRSGGLPTNWALLHPVQGTFAHYDQQPGANDYSYGAFRAVYYASIDAKRTSDPATLTYLRTVTAFTGQASSGAFCTVFVEGKTCYNDAASLSAPVAQLALFDSSKDQDLIGKTLLAHGSVQVPTADFFQATWYWLGLNAWALR